MKTLDCKRCPKCKEILGLDQFPCNGTHGWCRRCAAESVRKYRKTQQYRIKRAEYLARPEVQASRRKHNRLQAKRRSGCRITPKQKLLQHRCRARYRARQHEINGKDEAAGRQLAQVAMITREIVRIDSTAAMVYTAEVGKQRKAAA